MESFTYWRLVGNKGYTLCRVIGYRDYIIYSLIPYYPPVSLRCDGYLSLGFRDRI